MKSFTAAAALTLATLASQAQAQTGCAVSCFQQVITDHPPLSCTEANMYLCFCKDTSLQNYFIDCAKSSCGNNYQTAIEFGYSLCNDLGAPIQTQQSSSAAAAPTSSAAAQPSSSAAAQPSSSAAAQSSSAAAASSSAAQSSAAQSSAAQSSAAASSSKASSAQASATGASSSAAVATSAATTPGAPAPTTVRTTTVAQPTGGNSTTTVVPVNGAGALAGSGFAVVAGVAMAALQL
ncbi:unnamed protein product [Clonostachys rosea]|uniref:CFEM domain-containing protein n=1 Tax=Bionectria ochroleuca TaxID=29856 RepID=A0ABY6TYM8_BIOOC|nr:unnamed protein product [Clonostachys rosea]